ncbi:ATP-binding protein [Rugamonas apoptosis]|uniref:C4-dicarboxylate transport sensor protein DctB n=1 Tax=Rugamonas apoptosis TaxID=2758570 RepID=A0A7W2F7L3_9BURK|nr:ATP-binding protein [Rugamonas apoptosis]MBA5686585.1 sensor histidine kinase [Rugamonas apoptosis]
MKRAPSSLLLIPALIAAACIMAGAWLLGTRHARAELQDQAQRQLQLIAPDLQSVLQKFETLPFVLGFQPDLIQALAHPDDPQAIARLNSTLHTIQQQAKVGAIYVMNRDGLTLGASNWDQPLGFVGKNFSYRPYFHAALHGQAGRFYGIGTSTSEAGYFIAQPVYRDGSARGAVAGVVAVKISLAEFERTWRSSADPIVLADRSGVIFLSNRPDWIYRSLRQLDAATVQELARTQQYLGKPIAPLPANVLAPIAPVTQPVGELGWQLMLFPGQDRVSRAGAQWALAAALLLACAAASSWAIHQRRRRLEEAQASRAALQRAALQLEDRIAERTGQLSQTNASLEARYAKLQETEQLLRSTQNELIQAGKLAMLGQMAAGVTHELNQPLAAIRAFADNARTFLERGMTVQAAGNLGHIADASARMGAIISQLKGFARKDESVATVDLAACVRAACFLLQSEFRRLDVALEVTAENNCCKVTGDAVRIEQVLINLLRNALDAVEAGAPGAPRRVSVALACAGAHGPAHDHVREHAYDHAYALVSISDSGPGIPEQVVAHLFEPFFTTKPSGKGLGLGLAISSSIVQAMNGQLTARNLPDGGARFELRLPLLIEGEM